MSAKGIVFYQATTRKLGIGKEAEGAAPPIFDCNVHLLYTAFVIATVAL